MGLLDEIGTDLSPDHLTELVAGMIDDGRQSIEEGLQQRGGRPRQLADFILKESHQEEPVAGREHAVVDDEERNQEQRQQPKIRDRDEDPTPHQSVSRTPALADHPSQTVSSQV